MDSPLLVGPDVEGGRELLDALDEAGIDVRAALWYFVTSARTWRLMIATPVVDEKGPKAAYALIQSVLEEADRSISITLRDISAISPNSDLIQLLRSAIRTGRQPEGIRFTENVINGVLIEDAFIYRLL